MAAVFFAGAAIFSVSTSTKKDQKICAAVQGVRDDLVHSLRIIEKRALSQARTQSQRDTIIEAYEGKKKGQEGLITLIGNPDCP